CDRLPVWRKGALEGVSILARQLACRNLLALRREELVLALTHEHECAGLPGRRRSRLEQLGLVLGLGLFLDRWPGEDLLDRLLILGLRPGQYHAGAVG